MFSCEQESTHCRPLLALMYGDRQVMHMICEPEKIHYKQFSGQGLQVVAFAIVPGGQLLTH